MIKNESSPSNSDLIQEAKKCALNSNATINGYIDGIMQLIKWLHCKSKTHIIFVIELCLYSWSYSMNCMKYSIKSILNNASRPQINSYLYNQMISTNILSRYGANFDFPLHANQAYNDLTVYFLKWMIRFLSYSNIS